MQGDAITGVAESKCVSTKVIGRYDITETIQCIPAHLSTRTGSGDFKILIKATSTVIYARAFVEIIGSAIGATVAIKVAGAIVTRCGGIVITSIGNGATGDGITE